MITIVVGAQFGGEGKGKISAFLARTGDYPIVCRCGGPNSSHTIKTSKGSYRFRMLPTAVSEVDSLIVFGAGTLLHIPTLLKEMNDWNVPAERILIDFRAGVIHDESIREQRSDNRYAEIGSTLTGTGYATAERAKRNLTLAKDYSELSHMLADTSTFLFDAAQANQNILVEGHQGAMLSNYHGDYPYCSSRDSTAAAMLSELGLGLGWDFDVVLVVKTFQTRNHRGEVGVEIDPIVASKLGINEFGGGSNGVEDNRRRVGWLDYDVISNAVRLNGPNRLAVTGTDYLFPSMRSAKSVSEESADFGDFMSHMFRHTGVTIDIVSTGPKTGETYSRVALQGEGDKRNSSVVLTNKYRKTDFGT